MKKKLFTLFLTITLVLSFSLSVFAAPPEGPKDADTTIELVNQGTIYLGDTVTLLSTTKKEGNLLLSDSWTHLETDVNYAGVRSSKSVGDDDYYLNTLVFTPTAVGIYTFKYKIEMTANYNNYWIGEGQKDFEVILETTIVVENPAAPSVANAILKEEGISHRYHISGKTFGNYISDVAKAMENGAFFNGVSKNDVAAYKAAVYEFLQEKGAQLP